MPYHLAIDPYDIYNFNIDSYYCQSCSFKFMIKKNKIDQNLFCNCDTVSFTVIWTTGIYGATWTNSTDKASWSLTTTRIS